MKTNKISEEIVAQEIQDALLESENFSDCRIESFEEAGILTRDSGFILKTEEGEFQITIVRSR